MENAETKTITFKILSEDISTRKILCDRTVSYSEPEEVIIKFSRCGKTGKIIKHLQREYRLDIIYKLTRNNRCFEITLFDEPEDCGYCSILPDYDPSTYVLGNIVEERTNGKKKYEMAFGFDIEKKTFLELFELIHYNATGIVREYPNLNTPLEAELKDVVII